jgi:hypothetical protein
LDINQSLITRKKTNGRSEILKLSQGVKAFNVSETLSFLEVKIEDENKRTMEDEVNCLWRQIYFLFLGLSESFYM